VIRIFNTETRSKEELKTIEPGKVKMYVCGPTVYNFFTWATPAHSSHTTLFAAFSCTAGTRLIMFRTLRTSMTK